MTPQLDQHAVEPGATRSQLVDLHVRDAAVGDIVATLRLQHCAAVSFIEAQGPQHLDLDLQRAAIPAVLAAIPARLPSYRFETINGRAVLYPSAPEYQTVVEGVDRARVRRFDAADRYIAQLKRTVPSFAALARPSRVYFALGPSPFFDEPVSLREKGRVIEHFVDLLGRISRIYFTIVKAPTGVPAFEFGQVTCAPIVAPVHFTPCAEARRQPSSDSDVLERRLSVDVDGQPLSSVVQHLQSADHLPVSFIEGSPVQRVTEHLHDLPPHTLLDQMVSSLPGVTCLAGNGHLVIVPNDEASRARLEDVKITLTTPWHAASGLAGLLRDLPAFRDLRYWVEPPADPMLLNVEVSLARQGSVLELLVQVLGDDPHAYFVIKKLPSGQRALELGSVP